MVVLGTGILTWNASERRSDRYGSVYLMRSGNSMTEGVDIAPLDMREVKKIPIGTRGRLVAHVLETRDSTHIGDLFHGVYPQTPKVGEQIVLGQGSLFIEPTAHDGGTQTWLTVGVTPDDAREHLWMDIHALYRAHEQTVRLEFVPQ